MLINFGRTVTGNSGISVNANAVSMNSNQFNDVRLTVATGKMPQMFNLGTNAFNLLNITITNCSAPNAVTTGILMTEVAGGLVDKGADYHGLRFHGRYLAGGVVRPSARVDLPRDWWEQGWASASFGALGLQRLW